MGFSWYSKTESGTVTGLMFMLIAGILFIVGSFVCVLITFLGWYFAISGFFRIYWDRYQHREPHQTNMNLALIFYLIGIALAILGAVAFVIAAFSWGLGTVDTGSTAAEAFDNYLTNLMIATGIVVAGELCLIFARYKLLIELMQPNFKKFLRGVVALMLVVAVVAFALVIFLFSTLIGTYERSFELAITNQTTGTEMQVVEEDFEEFQEETAGIASLNLALAMISQIMFLMCFYFAWTYQKTRGALEKSLRAKKEEHRIKRTSPMLVPTVAPGKKEDIFETPAGKIQCPQCGRYMDKGYRKCPDCGSSIDV